MAVTLDVYQDDLVTLIGTLDQPYAISWLEERLDVGAGTFTIPHDSPVVTADPTILSRNNLVKVKVDGTVRAAWLIRQRQRQDGDTWHPIIVAGPGITDILSSAVVYPAGGLGQPLLSDIRTFGWMSIDFDDSAWLDADTLASLGTQDAPTPANFAGNPPDWPDLEAEWIWTEAPTGSPLTHPEGTCYFRRTLEIDGEPAGQPARIYVSAVNRWDCWFDASLLGSGGGHQVVTTFDVELVLGVDHVIAFRVVNADRSATYTGQNIGALLVTIRQLDDDGEPGAVLYRSYVNGPPGPVAGRVPGWRGLGYPADTPGVTPGYILKTLFDEAQSRGALTGLTIDFDATNDSDGVAWPEEIEFAALVGNDTILTVADRLKHYGVDVTVTPGLVFRAFSGRGTDRGTTPAVGASTVEVEVAEARDRTVVTEDEDIDALLVRSSSAWLQRPDPGPAANRREGFLSLGITPSAGEAADAADDSLAEFATALGVVSWTIAGGQAGVPTPWDDFEPGDTIFAPWVNPNNIVAAWAKADIRVDTIAGEVTDVGEVDYHIEGSSP